MKKKLLAYLSIILVMIAVQGSMGIAQSLERHFGIQGSNKKVVYCTGVENAKNRLEASREAAYIYYSRDEVMIDSKYGQVEAVVYGVKGYLPDFYYMRFLEGHYLIEDQDLLISSELTQALKEDGQVGKTLMIMNIPFKIVGVVEEKSHNIYTSYGVLPNEDVYAVETIADIDDATFNYRKVRQLTTFIAGILILLMSIILAVEIARIQVGILKKGWLFFVQQHQVLYVREILKKYKFRLFWYITEIAVLLGVQIYIISVTRKDLNFSLALLEHLTVGKGFTIVGAPTIAAIYVLQLSFIIVGILSIVYLAFQVFCNQLQIGIIGILVSTIVAYATVYLLGVEIDYSTTMPFVVLLGISFTQRMRV